ncbi:transcriptional regulator, TetR family [Mucilaginibacter pineti]|uniref:Transcriptional regulator, TetR family n=1 Tax=Mucilaginibacter pineti TaxID=1391627 RepID=A0A1G7LKK4_9SPHI|nr:TetR/AcrR family transcriptional regulator [Mucilaginibacter pineti]SDF50072.1 transcriptional regulator, TetR family [Mucilaginibacter pineti]
MKVPFDYDLVKNDIIKASSGVFMKYGFTKVSMQDISKASGKGRSTLYYYFKSKAELLDALAFEVISEMVNKSGQTFSPTVGFVENIESYYKAKLKILKKLLKQYSLLMEDLKEDATLAIIKKSKLCFNEEAEIISRIIQSAADRNEISSLTRADLKFLSQTLVTAFRSFELEMFLYGGMENFESKLNWLAQILYKGLK